MKYLQFTGISSCAIDWKAKAVSSLGLYLCVVCVMSGALVSGVLSCPLPASLAQVICNKCTDSLVLGLQAGSSEYSVWRSGASYSQKSDLPQVSVGSKYKN